MGTDQAKDKIHVFTFSAVKTGPVADVCRSLPQHFSMYNEGISKELIPKIHSKVTFHEQFGDALQARKALARERAPS